MGLKSIAGLKNINISVAIYEHKCTFNHGSGMNQVKGSCLESVTGCNWTHSQGTGQRPEEEVKGKESQNQSTRIGKCPESIDAKTVWKRGRESGLLLN